MSKENTRTTIPIACNLIEPEQVKRRQEVLEEVFGKVEEIEELADGFAFRFPSDDACARTLLDFILFERQCCPFFMFELVFEAERGPIWLQLRGAKGVKEFIKTELERAGIPSVS
jgi:hypothetical protein